MAVALTASVTKKTSKFATTQNRRSQRHPQCWFDAWSDGPYSWKHVVAEIARSSDPAKAKEAFHYTDERTHERVTFADYEAAQKNDE